VEVLGSVLPGRAVAAANVTTAEAQAEMNPATAGLEALLTAGRRMWLDPVEL
jgi:hypothetical protein